MPLIRRIQCLFVYTTQNAMQFITRGIIEPFILIILKTQPNKANSKDFFFCQQI